MLSQLGSPTEVLAWVVPVDSQKLGEQRFLSSIAWRSVRKGVDRATGHSSRWQARAAGVMLVYGSVHLRLVPEE